MPTIPDKRLPVNLVRPCPAFVPRQISRSHKIFTVVGSLGCPEQALSEKKPAPSPVLHLPHISCPTWLYTDTFSPVLRSPVRNAQRELSTRANSHAPPVTHAQLQRRRTSPGGICTRCPPYARHPPDQPSWPPSGDQPAQHTSTTRTEQMKQGHMHHVLGTVSTHYTRHKSSGRRAHEHTASTVPNDLQTKHLSPPSRPAYAGRTGPRTCYLQPARRWCIIASTVAQGERSSREAAFAGRLSVGAHGRTGLLRLPHRL